MIVDGFLANSGLGLGPLGSKFAESLAPGGRFASTVCLVASKTQPPRIPELVLKPTGRHRALPVQEADASLADNVHAVCAGWVSDSGYLDDGRTLQGQGDRAADGNKEGQNKQFLVDSG